MGWIGFDHGFDLLIESGFRFGCGVGICIFGLDFGLGFKFVCWFVI